MLVAVKRASCGMALVALKRTGCDVWQLECQASNVTASVQGGHILYGYTMLPVFFATDQLHCMPHCAEIQPMSQPAVGATCLYHGLVLHTSTSPVALPRHGNRAICFLLR